ncbi:MAG: glycerol-3-phosphate ABC transporter ATP-binding protein [Elusimicrobia bacterium RIFOXYA2_FULL_39_19]|nr:MAG: glycerol-3-phosphate ABC transporter ATP-binding protein [Elusimicrobia bacterium RIFOXYA2_FULL_39_19]
MSEVTLKNVVKRYDKVLAVNSVNFEIRDREFCVIVGPSGCGKSTTLRMIAGLEEITEGEIWIGNKKVNDVPPKDRDIAMVFQNYALYPHMKVKENMSFGLRLRGYTKEEIEQRVSNAANILDINTLLERIPKALSGGQRQRVALGRTIVRKPKVFLFDEPLSNLDAKLRLQMRAELKKLHERLQTTSIYVTHDQVEAMTLGDKIVIMKDGLIQQIADPITIYSKPANKFVAGFIGSPAMNFIDCQVVKKNNNELWLDEGKIQVKAPEEYNDVLMPYVDKPVVFGMRPEDIVDRLYSSISTPDNTVMVTVDVIEPLGNETLLHLTTGKNLFIARVNPYNQIKMHQSLEITFDLSKMHVFDKDTELAII